MGTKDRYINVKYIRLRGGKKVWFLYILYIYKSKKKRTSVFIPRSQSADYQPCHNNKI
jgi:hypothetical protein